MQNVTIIQFGLFAIALFGAFFVGIKWVERKKENSDKEISSLRKFVNESFTNLSNELSKLRIETTAQIGALDLKSLERYATWQSFKEFKDDLKSDINSRFDRHEKSTREQFDRLFAEIKRSKEGDQ